MLFTVQSDQIKIALTNILSVVDKKNTRPILNNVCFNLCDNKIEISGTDTEIASRIIIPGKVEKQISFCVNAKNISDIVRSFPEGEIVFDINEGTDSYLTITKDKINFSLLTVSSEEFPKLFFGYENNLFNLKCKDIVNFISITSYAISDDDTRPFLNGLFFQEVDSCLRIVATDAYTLSLYDLELPNVKIEQLTNGIIVPKKGVLELKNLAENYLEEELSFSVNDSFLFVKYKDEYFLSIRLIARDYPKYQAVIPGKISSTAIASTALLYDALRRIRLMASEKTNAVKFALSDGEVAITSDHPSMGKACEKFEIDYHGRDFEVTLNAKHLIEILHSLNDSEVIFELNNELSPILIKSSNIPNYLGIIMPLNC